MTSPPVIRWSTRTCSTSAACHAAATRPCQHVIAKTRRRVYLSSPRCEQRTASPRTVFVVTAQHEGDPMPHRVGRTLEHRCAWEGATSTAQRPLPIDCEAVVPEKDLRANTIVCYDRFTRRRHHDLHVPHGRETTRDE